MGDSQDRQVLVRAGTMHWVHWLVVALSLLLTVVAWQFSKQQISQKVEERFDHEASQVVELVKERMELYENALWGGVAFYDGSQEVVHDEWASYADSLRIDERYPGINGIGVIYNVKPQALNGFLAREREDRPTFKIHPSHDEDEYWPITYIEPAEANRQAIGLDMAFESNRYTAVQKARDTGQAQLTGPIVLVQDAKKTPGFLFYTPFYRGGQKPTTIDERRQHIEGVTYAPFIMSKLMQGTLAQQSRHVILTIRDGAELLYQDETADELDSHQVLYRKKIPVHFYGRTWTFDIQSGTAFLKASSSNQPGMILLGGIAIDSLLLIMFMLLSRANRRALAYADSMTEELNVKSDRLEKSNQDLEQFAYVASHDLKAPLRGVGNLTQWLDEDLTPVMEGEKAFDDELKKTVKGHIDQLYKRTRRLENLLENILGYSRAGAKGEEKVKVDVHQSIKDIGQLLNVEGAFTITSDEMPTLKTEKIPFEMVLRNLMSNAIKHHDRGQGKIHVSCRDLGDRYEFSVADDGPGIDPEYAEKIFDLFTTLKSRDQVEGSGMGLATLRKIVTQKKGRIWCEGHAPERGSTFKFTWPKEEA